ncbi:HAUS augmin-like complex subunit 3 [Pelobates cultripes]|uniref:HAUS augmin-like complex subunit 3 n=1 Tax=Pelobates cultripes TaxID=61616 RepID=A0AAD1SDV2_PELCU|nr:HAUS augmin-like complex subunit 3 [Pelobates cultripes]
MNSGERFVQTLRKAGYPKAPQLDGEDFDWLFETTNAKPFLDWFCASITEQNVVPDEKLQAFKELKESGKAILDEKGVSEVLKTCNPTNTKIATMEDVAIEKLEEEVESLQKLKNVRIHRRNKLQMVASGNSQLSMKLQNLEEEDAKKLKEILRALEGTNNRLNNELSSIVQGVRELMSFFTIPEEGCEMSSPTFLFQILLDKYLSSEEQHTAAITSFIKEHFDEGFSMCMQDSDGNVQHLPQGSEKTSEHTFDEKNMETLKLQLAYTGTKHKLIQSKAKGASFKAGLKWAEGHASSFQNKVGNQENLQARISSLNSEITQIQTQIDAIKQDRILELVKQNAQLLNMPILKGNYDLQLAHHQSYSKKQDVVGNHLLKQKASFEFLQLGYELELKKHRKVYLQLTDITENLKESANKLDERLLMMSDLSVLSSTKPRSNLDSKDTASHRLYQLLDGDQTQKLFRTYSGLESVAQKLNQDVTTLKDQLSVVEQEQALFLSKLDANLKSLQDFMYPEGKELLLNTPEVANHFQQLDSQLDRLNHVLLEVLEDLKVKRNILQSNKMHQIEKKLYVHFFQNEGQLKSIVESVESQTHVHPST